MWYEQIGAWWESAVASGMATLGGFNIASIGIGAKLWFDNIKGKESTDVISHDVAVVKENQEKIDVRLVRVEAKQDVILQALEGVFIAVNKLAQNSSININAKEELTKLSASVLPLFKTQEQLQNEISNIGASITKPLTDLEKQALAKKEELQKLATDKVNETQVKIDSTLNATFDKFKQGVGNLLDTAKDTILGDRQA